MPKISSTLNLKSHQNEVLSTLKCWGMFCTSRLRSCRPCERPHWAPLACAGLWSFAGWTGPQQTCCDSSTSWKIPSTTPTVKIPITTPKKQFSNSCQLSIVLKWERSRCVICPPTFSAAAAAIFYLVLSFDVANIVMFVRNKGLFCCGFSRVLLSSSFLGSSPSYDSLQLFQSFSLFQSQSSSSPTAGPGLLDKEQQQQQVEAWAFSSVSASPRDNPKATKLQQPTTDAWLARISLN